jgi:hypothetical protein
MLAGMLAALGLHAGLAVGLLQQVRLMVQLHSLWFSCSAMRPDVGFRRGVAGGWGGWQRSPAGVVPCNSKQLNTHGCRSSAAAVCVQR